MYLKSLEISGFKSFAKKGTLEFNSPITAIVGPNGSGKSNVAEAFRFVLGEQSIKSLRGKRGEDLIFNGGKSAGRQNRASVKVVFDNKNRALNLDFDEVTLERVVHRDSANEYFINGSLVRLKDITELLSGAHIGASGHHIISQGEADRILSANLNERREMIEDALGLKVYHSKKEESERKLEKTEENLKQVASLRREIAPHIKFLEKQVEKVEKAKEMRNELETLYKDYFKRENSYITYEVARIKNERLVPDKKLADLEKELSKAKDILAASTDKDVKSDELLSLESKLQAIRSDKDRLTREIGRLEGQIASEERILRKQQELAGSEEAKTIRFREVQSLADAIDIKITSAESVDDTTSLKSIFQSIKTILSEFIAKNKSAADVNTTAESEHEIERLTASSKKFSAELDSIIASEHENQKEYAKLQSDIEKEKDTNREAEKAVFRIMADQNEVISLLNTLKSSEERIIMIEADFKRELQEAATLIGRAVLDFSNVVISDKNGKELGDDEIALEDRKSQEDRRKVMERIKIRLEDSGGGSSEEILKEYGEVKERDEFLAREVVDLEKSAETLTVLIKDLEEKLNIEFKTGIEKINKQFQEFFALMFGGGSAGLQVVKQEKRKKKSDTDVLGDLSDDEGEENFAEEDVEEGIDISVNLPQKKIKSLIMLSGGERALTSIALLFAISQVNPPPFIILDETDAALDEANSRKYGEMVDTLSKFSQLILITHNRETMSRAGILYGVTMGSEGFSKLLSIKFDEAVEVAK